MHRMIRRTLIPLIAMAICPFPSVAQSFGYFIDGAELLRACRADRPYAYGIVAGIYDAQSEAATAGYVGLPVCLPPGATIPVMTKVVCDNLEGFPNLLKLTAAQVVSSSLYLRFRCADG